MKVRAWFSVPAFVLVGVAGCSRKRVDPSPPARAPLPNLVVSIDDHIIHMPGVPDRHEVSECVKGEEPSSLVRFTASITNRGDARFTVGDPLCSPDDLCSSGKRCTNDKYCWDGLHGHEHLIGLTKYWIEGEDGIVVPSTGRKQGFRLVSRCGPAREDDPLINFIDPGCTDTYSLATPCQLVDTDGLPAGRYRLFAEVNPDPRFLGDGLKNDCGSSERGERTFVESSYSDNCASIPIEIPAGVRLTFDLPDQRNNDNDGRRKIAIRTNDQSAVRYVVDSADLGKRRWSASLPAGKVRLSIESNPSNSVYIGGLDRCEVYRAGQTTTVGAAMMNGRTLVPTDDCGFELKNDMTIGVFVAK